MSNIKHLTTLVMIYLCSTMRAAPKYERMCLKNTAENVQKLDKEIEEKAPKCSTAKAVADEAYQTFIGPSNYGLSAKKWHQIALDLYNDSKLLDDVKAKYGHGCGMWDKIAKHDDHAKRLLDAFKKRAEEEAAESTKLLEEFKLASKCADALEQECNILLLKLDVARESLPIYLHPFMR